MSSETALHVEQVSKSYGRVLAVSGIDLAVPTGGVLALLGPSGSGKTTLLTCIAGFERPDSGRILLGERDVTRLPAHKRGIGMVFQRYALFPHMSVAENIAYPLRQRGLPRAEREERVRDALDLVQMSRLGDRLPAQLSGGQQQRVALARALVYRPPVLLLDEPLGALDRKLRDQLQIEIKQLQRRLGTTMVLVTHDQQEALSMADHIVLLRAGRIEQTGTPRELHERPVTPYVADFIGEANRIRGIAEAGGTRLRLPSGTVLAGCPAGSGPRDGEAAELAVRPTRIRLAGADQPHPAIVREIVYGGETVTILLDLEGIPLWARRPAAETDWVVGESRPIGWSATDAWIFPSDASDR